MNTKKLVLAALAVTLLSTGAAFAGPGNNGNGNGRSAVDNGRNTNGAVASELKWRNAAHASEQAFINASPNSAVGILATYRTATQELNAALDAAGFDLASEVRDPTVIQAEIDALGLVPRPIADIEAELAQAIIDGDDTTALANELADAEAFDAEAYVDALEALVTELGVSEGLVDVIAAEEAATAEVGADLLSDAAYDALWDMLDK